MKASFHNHTRWSDGTSSMPELYAAALRQGVDLFGVADHFCIFPDGRVHPASIAPDDLIAYVEEARSLDAPVPGRMLAGIEVDWFSGQEEALAALLDPLPFDFRIGSIHHVEGRCIDASAGFWEALRPDERDQFFLGYWELLAEMAQSGLFELAAHLDLPKKFGFQPGIDLAKPIANALDALADQRMAVELNTAGWRMPCGECYPAPEILRECCRRGIQVAIGADAHTPGHLLFGYDRAVKMLVAAGCRSLVAFRGRQPFSVPLLD